MNPEDRANMTASSLNMIQEKESQGQLQIFGLSNWKNIELTFTVTSKTV